MAELGFEAASGFVCDVLVQGTGGGARSEDARDGFVLESTKAEGVTESAIEIGGGVTLTQEQDLPSMKAAEAGLSDRERLKERGARLAHLLEGGGELREIGHAFSTEWRVQPLGVELEMRATRGELVLRDAAQVRGVHEQLALGDAYRQEIGDVVVGHGVLVALVMHVAFEVGDAVHDARGIIRVKGQRQQVRLLDGEALERSGAVARAKVADLVEPASELGSEVVEVPEAAAIEE